MSVSLLVILVLPALLTVSTVPEVRAYKATTDIPLPNGKKVTILFSDNFPDSSLQSHIALLQRDVPRIAELFYMPDHDFDITYIGAECGIPEKASGGYRQFCIEISSICPRVNCEETLIHELVHVFQAEAFPNYSSISYEMSAWTEATATAVTDILMRKVEWVGDTDSVLVSDNGPALYDRAREEKDYHLETGWIKLYAYKPTVFREFTSQMQSLLYRDVFHALLGEAILDSRPLAKWVYDQGLGPVGSTDSGLYMEVSLVEPPTGIKTRIWQHIGGTAQPIEVQPQRVVCRFHRMTGEFLAEIVAENGFCPPYYARMPNSESNELNEGPLRVDIRAETALGVLEKRIISLKDHESAGGGVIYYNYLALINDNELPLLVNGTATINVQIIDGSTWNFQSPVINGVVKFSVNGTYGMADIDISTPSFQYHYENFPISLGGRGVVVDPFTFYLGLHVEKWHVGSNENAHLVFTSYPPISSGSLTLQYKRQNEEGWQTLLSGIQFQNGRYEFEWGPTGEQQQAVYLLKTTWSDGTRTIASNPALVEREAGATTTTITTIPAATTETTMIETVTSQTTFTTETVISEQPTPSNPPETQPTQRGCIIATAAYGSELAPEVFYMRYVRDKLMGSTRIGGTLVHAFNAFYYSWSPSLARIIAASELLQVVFRVLLLPLVSIIHITAWLFTIFGGGDFASVVAFTFAAFSSITTYILLPAYTVRAAWKRSFRNKRPA